MLLNEVNRNGNTEQKLTFSSVGAYHERQRLIMCNGQEAII